MVVEIWCPYGGFDVMNPPPSYMNQARGRDYDDVLAFSRDVGSTLKEGLLEETYKRCSSLSDLS